MGLGSAATGLLVLFGVSVLSDLGLETWVSEGRFDVLALHLAPLLVVVALFAAWAEQTGRPWLGQPLAVAATALLVGVLELFSLDGKALERLGVSLAAWQPEDVASPTLLDTVAAMTLAGITFHAVGRALERRDRPVTRSAAWLLVTISPFTILEPTAWLVDQAEYSLAFTWTYLALALTIAALSHFRQRRSFYYAGLANTGLALWFIADQHEWLDHASWAVAVVLVGAGTLALGFALDVVERRRGRLSG